MMSGSHWVVQLTRTTVLWPWRTLVKRGMPCSASLTWLLVANNLLLVKMGWSLGIGSFAMELEFPVMVISTEPEVRVWYFWTVEEVEWLGSTAVRYLIQWMLSRPHTLEFTQQAMVRYRIIREFWVWVLSWDLICSCLYIVRTVVYLYCTDVCLQLCQ